MSVAAAFGNLDVIKLLVETSPYTTIPNYEWGPVEAAVQQDHVEVLEYLWGIIPDLQNKTAPDTGDSLLHVAADYCSGHAFKWLLPHFSNINLTNNAGDSPLHVAMREDNWYVINALLAIGVDTNAQNAEGDTVLHILLRLRGHEEEALDNVDCLLSEDVSPDTRNHAGERPVDLTDDPRIIEMLEDEPIFRRDFPVHVIARNGRIRLMSDWLATMTATYPDENERHATIAAALTQPDKVRPNYTFVSSWPHQGGRTVYMQAAMAFASDDDSLQSLDLLLPYIKPVDFSAQDNVASHAEGGRLTDGKTILDHFLGRCYLACKKNRDQLTNVSLLRILDALVRLGKIELDSFDALPQELDGFRPRLCPGYCFDGGKSKAKLTKLAANHSWDELQKLLRKEVDATTLNDTDDMGYTALHHAAQLGHVETVRLLSEQPHVSLDEENLVMPHTATPNLDNSDETALMLAAKANRPACVRLLLAAGADANVDYDFEEDAAGFDALRENANDAWRLVYDSWEVAFLYPAYYIVRVPNVSTVKQYLEARRSPLHVAMTLALSEDQLENCCDNHTDYDAQDTVPRCPAPKAYAFDGETPLTVAARHGVLSNVLFLLGHDVDVDIPTKAGASALMLAALGGHVAIVDMLLDHLADMDLVDAHGQTVFDLLELWLSKHGASPTPQSTILDKLHKEAQIRENSPAYQEKLALSLVAMRTDEAFRHQGFAKVLSCSADLAQALLDDHIVVTRHDAAFHEAWRCYQAAAHTHLDAVYGPTAATGALTAVVKLDTKDPIVTFETQKTCLEHPVFNRLLDIKWELFGQRKYLEQLLMNMLLLLTTTTSSLLFDDATTAAPPAATFFVGMGAIVFVAFGFLAVQALRPTILWRLARLVHDGRLTLDPRVAIPNLPAKKTFVRRCLLAATLVATLVVTVPLLVFMRHLDVGSWFSVFNNIVLATTAVFFLHNELQEAKIGLRQYMASTMNVAQLLIYALVLLVFVPVNLDIVTVSTEFQVGLGGFLTLALWVLSLQFLEVVPSASFVLPMMSDLFGDISNFFILFSVFQVGLTITFYQLFRVKPADDSHDAFDGIGQSFMTTYFVAFGQLPTDALGVFTDATSGLYVFTALLMMLHSAVVVIVLLNVLLAMMNKTVDGGLEKAKTRALLSYARCILRLEEAMGLDADGTSSLLHLSLVAGTRERTPLVSANGAVLNPVLGERVAKAQLGLTPAQADALYARTAAREAWQQRVQALGDVVDSEIAFLADGFDHVRHFIDSDVAKVFAEEFALLETTKAQLQATVDEARWSRGLFQDKVIAATEARVKKELAKLQSQMMRLWKPKFDAPAVDDHAQCMLVYQLAQRSTVEKQLTKVIVTVLEAVQTAGLDAAEAEELAEDKKRPSCSVRCTN
ncbi:hypothetical protein ACHHYP_12264 [Achlya hypogyna]|uniref:Ion transport domain-containing protein n=1 Tax=Achlya hypogyna TaxID=1202772 RepID=A0A1V9ZHI2_ACHHY|nr:hypothetical protein ACHHYP_12264 [Achlya hypogyna]